MAPLMISIEDKPPLQDVYIANDTLEPWNGTPLIIGFFLEHVPIFLLALSAYFLVANRPIVGE